LAQVSAGSLFVVGIVEPQSLFFAAMAVMPLMSGFPTAEMVEDSCWERPEEKILQGALARASNDADGEALWSLLDLTAPVRSQILFNLVSDLLWYSGANEVNAHLDSIRAVCRELRDQIDEECLTFNYDDTCGLASGSGGDHDEVQLLNAWIRRHPRLKYFECLLHSIPKFRALLEGLELPPGTQCSFVLEFKVKADDIRWLLRRFRVRRLNIIAEESRDDRQRRETDWQGLQTSRLRTLCVRRCTNEIARALLSATPRLYSLQIFDSRLQSDPGIRSSCLRSLSLIDVSTLPEPQFNQIIAGCQALRSLYISKCHISNITIALPWLELLSVTHCRQLSDRCCTAILDASNNPSLRFVDLTENRGLVSPVIAHPGLEIAWLMHCPQIAGHAVTHMFRSCPSLTAANLVQSSIESAMICSPALRTLELATSQKLSDAAVTHLLQHCPSLTFLDVGHCSQLLEPRFAHTLLETILLSFCVNLRESAIVDLFANCPSIRYVELAVCMFDMTRFQRECSPNCHVVVNFDF